MNFAGESFSVYIRDDGSHYIEVIDYSWEDGCEWSLRLEVPNDPDAARQFWFETNEAHFCKICCCPVHPCPHAVKDVTSHTNEQE